MGSEMCNLCRLSFHNLHGVFGNERRTVLKRCVFLRAEESGGEEGEGEDEDEEEEEEQQEWKQCSIVQ